MIAKELSEEMSRELNFWPLSYHAYTFMGYFVVLSVARTASNQMLVWLLIVTNKDTIKHNYIFLCMVMLLNLEYKYFMVEFIT
jgi:hypothetical protein